MSNRQHVLVEYVFEQVPTSTLQTLPERVQRAVDSLVGRERLPSDENVQDLVAQAPETPSPPTQLARVRIMLPENVAIDLALHRSFQEGGNVPQTRPLTVVETRRLMRRSRAVRVRQLRAARLDSAQRLSHRETCVVCMEKIRYRPQKIYLDPCGHVFHQSCIVPWLARLPRTCPSCRVSVDLEARDEEESTTRVTRAQLQAETDITL